MSHETAISNDYLVRNNGNTLVWEQEEDHSKLFNPDQVLNLLEKDTILVSKWNTLKSYKNCNRSKAKCFHDMSEHANINDLVDSTKLITYLIYCNTQNKLKPDVQL